MNASKRGVVGHAGGTVSAALAGTAADSPAGTPAGGWPDSPASGIDDDVVDLAVEVLRILADPTRLRIAALVLDNELSVGEIAEAVQRPVPGVSQHLAKMRLAHLVNTRREGTSVRYRIDDEHIRQLVLDTVRHVEHLLSDRPAHHEADGR